MASGHFPPNDAENHAISEAPRTLSGMQRSVFDAAPALGALYEARNAPVAADHAHRDRLGGSVRLADLGGSRLPTESVHGGAISLCVDLSRGARLQMGKDQSGGNAQLP